MFQKIFHSKFPESFLEISSPFLQTFSNWYPKFSCNPPKFSLSYFFSLFLQKILVENYYNISSKFLQKEIKLFGIPTFFQNLSKLSESQIFFTVSQDLRKNIFKFSHFQILKISSKFHLHFFRPPNNIESFSIIFLNFLKITFPRCFFRWFQYKILFTFPQNFSKKFKIFWILPFFQNFSKFYIF